MMDWEEIARKAQEELEESRAQRQRLHDAELRAAEREQRRRIATASVTKPEPKKEPTPEEKRQAALQTLTAFALHQSPPVDEQPVEQPRAANGTFASKIAERERQQKARRDERSSAAETLFRFLGAMRK